MWTRDLGFLRRHGWKILAAITAYALGMSVVERSTLPLEFWFGFLGAIGAMALLWLAVAGMLFGPAAGAVRMIRGWRRRKG